MRAITVRQPWAWAIIHGGKDVENRTRNIAGGYRGPVAIHAGLAWDDRADGLFYDASHPIAWALAREDKREFSTAEHGVILGVVDLTGVHMGERSSDVNPGCWNADRAVTVCSPWAMRDHHHLTLSNPRPLHTPVPAKGRLGLWTLPADVEAAVVAQLGGAS